MWFDKRSIKHVPWGPINLEFSTFSLTDRGAAGSVSSLNQCLTQNEVKLLLGIDLKLCFCPHKSDGMRRVSEAVLNKQKHQTLQVETTNGCAAEGRGHIPEEPQTRRSRRS